jgi:hypothetical protein
MKCNKKIQMHNNRKNNTFIVNQTKAFPQKTASNIRVMEMQNQHYKVCRSALH